MRQKGSRTRIDSPMTLHGHLKEARNRLFVIFAVFVLFACGAYYFHAPLMTALLVPLDGQTLSYLNPGGGFNFVFSVTIWAGLALTTPVIISSIYTFIAPALPRRAQSRGGLILVSSYFLFIAGALFGYFYAIPGALQFLIGFGDEFVQAMLTADAYLNFVLVYTVGLGVLFQIPILMMIIHWITPLKPLRLLRFERYVIAIAFVAAAIITPTPDIANQMVVAAPFIGMYQVGLVGVSLSHMRQKRGERLRQKSREELREQEVIIEAPPASPPSILEVALEEREPVVPARPVKGSRSVDGFVAMRPRAVPRNVGQVSVPSRSQGRSGGRTGARPPQLRQGQPAMDIFVSTPAGKALDSGS